MLLSRRKALPYLREGSTALIIRTLEREPRARGPALFLGMLRITPFTKLGGTFRADSRP